MKILVVGLGYVGRPLAEALSQHYTVFGYDTEKNPKGSFRLIDMPEQFSYADVIIVTVQTPVDAQKNPDLSFVKEAMKTVGSAMKEGTIVVLESTVYPGVTEDICVPILEEASGMKLGEGFTVGYSPERINPGDTTNTLSIITKVVAGSDDETTKVLGEMYGKISPVYMAPSIKVAEASKIMENIQRDVNIGLMNELSIVFSKKGIDVQEVIDAASTKWNFHGFTPGLVGGHCISVDPYFLSLDAEKSGVKTELVMKAREINESMVKQVVKRIKKILKTGKKIVVFGVTYKENVPDTRNSKAFELIQGLQVYHVTPYDPLVLEQGKIPPHDLAIIFSPHEMMGLTLDTLKEAMNEEPIIFDLKRYFSKEKALEKGFQYLYL